MQPSTPKRVALYTTGTVVVAALAAATYLFDPDAEVGTLLSSAQTQAQMASAIDPDTDNEEGRALRQKVLAEARDFWTRAHAQEPEALDVIETGAYLDLLEGKPEEAAENYGRMIGGIEDAGFRHNVALRHAYCHVLAGQFSEASSALQDADPAARKTVLLRARIAQNSGDLDGARRVLTDLVETMEDDDVDLLRVTRGLAEAEAFDVAVVTIVRASIRESIRNYELARLKAQLGDADEALGLLTRSLSEQDQLIDRRFGDERDFWIQELGEQRVSNLETSGATATPPKGG